jgi:hypothetical protein
MRQFLPVLYCLLSKDSRKVLLHEGVKVCVAFSRLEIFSFEEGEGNYNFQQSLLIVDSILHAIESCDSFQ